MRSNQRFKGEVRPAPERVSPSKYDAHYFLHACEGSGLYAEYGGTKLGDRHAAVFDIAKVRVGETVVDVGCGRGELTIACAKAGARVYAIDYAPAALEIAWRTIKLALPAYDADSSVVVIQGDATRVPLPDSSADLVLMADIVEHLIPAELSSALAEAYRVLRPGGRLVVHTMPNRWYYSFGYPVYRLALGMLGSSLPRDPRDRWEYVKEVHVNEQSPRSLAARLREIGFRCRVWVTSVTPAYRERPWVRYLRRCLPHMYPINLILCNDIMAVARKPACAQPPGLFTNERGTPSAAR